MNGKKKKASALVALMFLSACADYDSYRRALEDIDSAYVVGIDGKLDSLTTGIADVDSAVADGFRAVTATIVGLKDKVARLERQVEGLKKENERLHKIIDGYRNPDGKPFRLLPTEGGRGPHR